MNKLKREILDVLDEKIGFVEGLEIEEKSETEFDVYLNDKLLESISITEKETSNKESFTEYIINTSFFNELK